MPSEFRRNGSSFQKTGQVNIPTTAGGTLLLAQLSSGNRSDVTFLNMDDANTVYIGNNGLTANNGFPIAPGAAITRSFNSSVYALSVGGTVRVAYITSED